MNACLSEGVDRGKDDAVADDRWASTDGFVRTEWPQYSVYDREFSMLGAPAKSNARTGCLDGGVSILSSTTSRLVGTPVQHPVELRGERRRYTHSPVTNFECAAVFELAIHADLASEPAMRSRTVEGPSPCHSSSDAKDGSSSAIFGVWMVSRSPWNVVSRAFMARFMRTLAIWLRSARGYEAGR